MNRSTVRRIAALALAMALMAVALAHLKERHMLVGVYQPYSPGSYNQVASFATQAGFTPRITSYYTSSFDMPFNVAFAERAASSGTMVLLQWQPRGTTNAAVAAGQEDAVIVAAAKAIASVNFQVVVSYGQEMNGDWYEWGNVAPDSAAEYIAAYRHIWEVFEEEGVRNVTWMWDPNISYEGSSPLKNWYPGDQYVDWVALDGYYSSPGVTFASLFGPSIVELRSFTSKPLFIGETGVTGGAGPAQLSGLFAGADLAGAIGILYFDETQSGDPEHQDWRLENNAANMGTFRGLVQQYADRPLFWPSTS